MRPGASDRSWYQLLKRGSGGCNDLMYSGHMLVAVLTAMAWTVCFLTLQDELTCYFRLNCCLSYLKLFRVKVKVGLSSTNAYQISCSLLQAKYQLYEPEYWFMWQHGCIISQYLLLGIESTCQFSHSVFT